MAICTSHVSTLNDSLTQSSHSNRSGQDITFSELSKALRDLYGLSYVLSYTLALIAILVCGHSSSWHSRSRTLNPDALNKHNLLEHDASLVHEDTLPGDKTAPYRVSHVLLHNLLTNFSSDEKTLSASDLVRDRIYRESPSPNKHLSKIREGAALAEVAIILKVFGKPDGPKGEKKIPLSLAAEFLGEERIPKDWVTDHKTTLFGCEILIHKLKVMFARFRKCEKKLNNENP